MNQLSLQSWVMHAAPLGPENPLTPLRSYETAKRLARSGASVDEIVASSGVAGTEAHLLRRLHGARLLDDEPRNNAA